MVVWIVQNVIDSYVPLKIKVLLARAQGDYFSSTEILILSSLFFPETTQMLILLEKRIDIIS